MEDILFDSESETKGKPTIYSRIAFGFSVFTVLLCLIIMSTYYSHAEAISGIPVNLMVRTALCSMVAGFVFSIISLVKREKLKYFKVIAVIVNFLFFVLLLAAMFAAIMDIRKVN